MTLPLSMCSIPTFDWKLPTDYYHLSLYAAWLLAFAALPALLFAVNVFLFQRPGREWNKRSLPPVSVLIPARDEELSIAAAIESVLSSRGVELELIVLDDSSLDRTAEIVREWAGKDPRVRLETAPPLPPGWNGKQRACWVLASLARYDVFCFLDADVRLGREAIYRMLSEIHSIEGGRPQLAMASGFPAQETGTFWEKLLIPMIHFVLLGYLPLPGEHWTGRSAFAAGCGQFLMVRKDPYFASGGHSANPQTMHDGLLLPKLFRRNGFRTGVFDLSRDAQCRMYSTGAEVWRGLAKNATEGMASWGRLPVFTILLLAGQVLPLPFALWTLAQGYYLPSRLALLAVGMGYAIRCVSAWRYRQSWLGVLLHPLGVLMLLALQWYAFLRKLSGGKATWKQREYGMQ